MIFEAKAPAKVILCGEHSVVHGTHALACAIDLYTRIKLSTKPSSEYELLGEGVVLKFPKQLTSSKTRPEVILPLQFLSQLETVVTPDDEPAKASEIVVEKVKKLNIKSEALRTAVAIFCYVFLLVKSKSSRGISKTIEVSVTTDIPVGVGLGSSASYTVCLCKVLVKAFSISLSKKEISDLAYKGEFVAHGIPSGVDNAVITYGGALLFKKSQDGINIELLSQAVQLQFVLIDTGIARSTKKLVEGVSILRDNFPKIIIPIFDSMNEIVLKATKFLQQAGTLSDEAFDKLSSILAINQGLLDSLGVGHTTINEVVEICHGAGVKGVKLTGAGGGGCVLALLRSESEKTNPLYTALERRGFSSFSAGIDTIGAV